MAVLDKEAFMAAVNDIVGESTEESTLTFLANMRDTYNSLVSATENVVSQSEYDKLQGRYDELSRNYRERFLSGGLPPNKDEEDNENDNEKRAKSVKFGDLFTPRK